MFVSKKEILDFVGKYNPNNCFKGSGLFLLYPIHLMCTNLKSFLKPFHHEYLFKQTKLHHVYI